ncbi:MAG: hypothetical protein HYX92_10840 [Chloroflexi bacterium]|nr:hypothetical protein [Chloroflexota bacterium]
MSSSAIITTRFFLSKGNITIRYFSLLDSIIMTYYNYSMKRLLAFEGADGDCPYRDFMAELRRSGKSTKRIELVADLLRERGFELARNDYVAHIEGKIWELKAGPFRVFFFESDDAFVLLNG